LGKIIYETSKECHNHYKEDILNAIEKDDELEEEEEPEMEELELQEDIYCFTFFKFIHEYDPSIQKDLLIKCVVTFVFQTCLIYFIFADSGGLSSVIVGDYTLNFSRMICGYLLHYNIIPEVRCAIGQMVYIKNNRRGFNQASNFIPFLIALMKFTAGVFTEFVNILMIIQSNDVASVV